MTSIKRKSTTHSSWVKITHWIVTLSFLLLLFTGTEILMVHPRLYWGEVGNDLTPALMELPISRNYKHGGWTAPTPFTNDPNGPVSAGRTIEIFNQNSWGRSLHFLSGWFLIVAGLVYLISGLISGHLRRDIVPRRKQWSRKAFAEDFKLHLLLKIPAATGGPHYGLLQRSTYMVVVFVLLPLMVITGFTMSPAVTNPFPFLLQLFGGYQSARTIHFFTTTALTIFLAIHIFMVIRSGFREQMLSMITTYEKADHHEA